MTRRVLREAETLGHLGGDHHGPSVGGVRASADSTKYDHGHDHGRIVANDPKEKRVMTTEATGTPGPRTIKASEFKAKCLKLMDEVAESGEEIVITKHGRPVSRLAPYREKPKSWFGRDRDIIQIHGDITEPIDVEWEAVTGKHWDDLL